ncbi:multidrug transporter [Pseudomonas sp. GCM10022188]|uniref:multidrug transporter n=1 Tax=Pseudomonas TaxID=286 RepID=UPI001E44281F|nr:multidrug transporter [Pseudomonas oryzagri]MCC6075677.1 multidrug transporter [Pseudomonas oryzagri]
MLIGTLLILSWLALLIRYPAWAIPLNLAAVFALGLVALGLAWQEQGEQRRLERVELTLALDAACPADRPLRAHLRNGSDATLHELRWQVGAYQSGDSINLADNRYDSPHYRAPHTLLPDSDWQECLPLPPLRAGYRPSSLEFRAERLRGHFGE